MNCIFFVFCFAEMFAVWIRWNSMAGQTKDTGVVCKSMHSIVFLTIRYFQLTNLHLLKDTLSCCKWKKKLPSNCTEIFLPLCETFLIFIQNCQIILLTLLKKNKWIFTGSERLHQLWSVLSPHEWEGREISGRRTPTEGVPPTGPHRIPRGTVTASLTISMYCMHSLLYNWWVQIWCRGLVVEWG